MPNLVILLHLGKLKYQPKQILGKWRNLL